MCWVVWGIAHIDRDWACGDIIAGVKGVELEVAGDDHVLVDAGRGQPELGRMPAVRRSAHQGGRQLMMLVASLKSIVIVK